MKTLHIGAINIVMLVMLPPTTLVTDVSMSSSIVTNSEMAHHSHNDDFVAKITRDVAKMFDKYIPVVA